MNYLDYALNYLDKNIIQLLLTAIVIGLFLIARGLLVRVVKKHALLNELMHTREVYVKKFILTVLVIVTVTVIGIIWEVSLKGLSVYFASVFAVVGVALFATWSILSNLTASAILFFFYPYRIGSKVRIVDGDNSIEGEIADLTLFYMKIRTESEQLYSYPNNLAIQKPILHLSEPE